MGEIHGVAKLGLLVNKSKDDHEIFNVSSGHTEHKDNLSGYCLDFRTNIFVQNNLLQKDTRLVEADVEFKAV